MKALAILIGLRMRASLGRVSGVLMFFGLPAMLLLLTSGLFANGHPFERKRLAVIEGVDNGAFSREVRRGFPPPRHEDGAAVAWMLARFEDLRVETVESQEKALRRLRSRSLSAVLVLPSSLAVLRHETTPGWRDRPPQTHLHVAPRDELFGRGLAKALPFPIDLRIEPVPPFAYMHYLFPGLITWTIMVSGFLGMGYSMARLRRAQFLKKLSLLPLSRGVFVGAQLISRSLLTLGQLAVLWGLAALVLGLRAGPLEVALSALVTLLGLLAFMGAGFALASRIHAEAALMDAANAITVVLILLSEVFFPVDELPAALRSVSAALPSTQLARLLRAVILDGETDPATLGPSLAILLAWTVALYAVAVLTFRWHED